LTLTDTRWTCEPYAAAAAHRLGAELGLSPTAAAILARRGHDTPEAARRHLRAEDAHDPFALSGMEAACATVLDHVGRGSRIVVHGDYDVDGVCSTAIVVRVLRGLGASPRWRLPSRLDDGYGLTPGTVDALEAEGAELVITTDCGITSAAEVELLQGRGIDVVVTDHHRPGGDLPACPVVHPALDGHPFPDLCAAGVAYKLAQALLTRAGADPTGADEDLDLVALATVADLVPMRGENRRLVRAGLAAMARTRKPGLRALLRISGGDRGAMTEHVLGFRLAPRINAAGRLQRADAALELLLTEDEDRATQVADELDLLNRERRDVETRILFAAEAARAKQAEQPAYVLSGEGWHPGVIGIVASRLVERYHRPCVLIALEDGGGRGSGRSIAPYDLHAGLAACSGHLRRFGGHRMAAGLEVDAGEVEAFRAALVAHAAASLAPEDLTAVQPVDVLVPGSALGLGLAEELERLGPFGAGNPRPTLLVPAARVSHVTGMGEGGEHARFTVSSGGARARGVAFRTSGRALAAALDDGPHDVAVTLESNEWNGTVEPRLVLRSLASTVAGPCTVLGEEAEFWPGVERELGAALPGPDPGGAHDAAPTREHCDRRGEGLAGIVGHLLSSGEPALLVCADVPRRRSGVEALIAGLAPDGATEPPGLVSWPALERAPDLAAPYAHLVALDPPSSTVGEALLTTAPAPHVTPGGGLAVLAWGAPESEFARSVARTELDLREALAELYRALRSAPGAAGAALERLLCGDGAHPRSPVLCARLLKVLGELGLTAFVGTPEGGPRCDIVDGAPRTALERSATYRAAQARLERTEAYLDGGALRPRKERAPPMVVGL